MVSYFCGIFTFHTVNGHFKLVRGFLSNNISKIFQTCLLGRECLILLHTQTLVVILLFAFVSFPMMTPWIVKKRNKTHLPETAVVELKSYFLFSWAAFHFACYSSHCSRFEPMLSVWGQSLATSRPLWEYSVGKNGFSQKWTRTGLAENRQIKTKVFDTSDRVEKLANSRALRKPWFVNPDPIRL